MGIPLFSRSMQLIRAAADWRHAKAMTGNQLIALAQSRRVELATTISLEELESLGLLDQPGIEKVLSWYFDTLGIRTIRIGLRWDKLYPQGYIGTHTLDISYYKQYLDIIQNYCRTNDLTIVLNLGPIKVFRWPEQHIPGDVLQAVGRVSIVEAHSPLADYAVDHLTKLIQYLKREYPVLLQHSTRIQLENELFNPFGELRTVASIPYYVRLVDICNKFLPGKSYLLNGSGLFDAKQCIECIKQTHANTGVSRFELGIDYYYTGDQFYKHNWTRKLDHVTTFPLVLSSPTLSKERTKLAAQGIQVIKQVTEAQFELWGRAKHPGSSLVELNWVVVRCLRYFEPSEVPMINLWGLERTASRVFGTRQYEYPYSPQQDALITETIRAINQRG
jgi:hypothetical protein